MSTKEEKWTAWDTFGLVAMLTLLAAVALGLGALAVKGAFCLFPAGYVYIALLAVAGGVLMACVTETAEHFIEKSKKKKGVAS